MQITDSIADMLTRIRNANSAKHDTVKIPASNMKKAIAQILLDEGYIKGMKVNGKTYTANDALTGYWDTRWYTQYMDKDDELEGYLRLPNELDNFDNFDVYFEVQRDGSTDKYGVNFHIKK